MVGELAAVTARISAAILYAVVVPSKLLGLAVVQGKTRSGRMALTFDDGPSEKTPAVLDALARARPGDRRAANAPAVEQVLPDLAGRGLRCVTLSELLS